VDVAALNVLSNEVIGAAIEVHRTVGPGLLEAVYSECLQIELESRGIRVSREVIIPLNYKGHQIEHAYRLDLVVEDELVVEVKAVDDLLPVHQAQLLTYLKLTGLRLGLLMNFDVVAMHRGIKRVVNGL
jgi:GxxExxY protein